MATVIMTTKNAANPELSKLGVGAGSQESAIPALPKPTMATASGVRNPISNAQPLTTASKPTIRGPNVRLPQPAR